VLNVGDRERLVPGATYRFRGVGKGPGEPLPPEKQSEWGGREWAYPPGDYRLVGLSYPVRFLCTGRQEVVYEGLGGSEAGKLFHCPLEDFARHFTLLAAPPAPEKVLDHRVQGSGV
jgi:hypothetical protein